MNTNNQRIIDDCTEDINKIKKWIDHNPTDSLIKYLVPYAVVRASGTIEYVFKQMIYEYLSDGAGEDVKSYLMHMIIDSSSNPKTGIMAGILQQFNSSKASVFTASLNDDEKGRWNSLVSLRNDVAHGRNISITISEVARAFDSGKNILQNLEQVLSQS